jgi:hydrogenase/urease accessory protein HupE
MSWRVCRLALPLWVIAQTLFAHTISLTYADIAIEGQQVRWSLKLPVPELDLVLELDRNHDGNVDLSEIHEAQPGVQQYVLSKIAVVENGRALPGTIGDLRLWKDPEGHPFVQTEIVYHMAAADAARLTLHCDLLRDAVSSHQTLAKICTGGQVRDFVFEHGRDYVAQVRPRAIDAVVQFIRMGILHIFTGYDHIAFLLGVVLIGGSFRTILKVVTSFTIAHSLTLALAAFRLVELPSRVVESGIALSIMYISLENLFFQKVDRRWIVTFFFGLIHGFGFASALQEANLTRNLMATALFSFNFGVEIGQLCIVALLLPALLRLSRMRLCTPIVKTCSAAILILGTVWFCQRVWGT